MPCVLDQVTCSNCGHLYHVGITQQWFHFQPGMRNSYQRMLAESSRLAWAPTDRRDGHCPECGYDNYYKQFQDFLDEALEKMRQNLGL